MPETFSVIEVFDVFFKLHNVLNVSYEPNLQAMMNFLAYFVYSFDDNGSSGTENKKKKTFVPTNRMHQVFSEFPNLNGDCENELVPEAA